MPSEKLTRILRSRSPFAPEQIEGMSESEGWAWVYGHASPRKEHLPSVCFTGFAQGDRDKLSALARDAHLERGDVGQQVAVVLVRGGECGRCEARQGEGERDHPLEPGRV